MSLVYCCSQRSFFTAVDDWVEYHSSSQDELAFVSSVLHMFMTQSTYAPLLCVRSTKIFSFELTTFEKSFPQWTEDERKTTPGHIERINRVASLVLELLHDKPWAIGNGLVVNDLLNNSEKKLLG